MALTKQVTLRSLHFSVDELGVLLDNLTIVGVREIKDNEEIIKIDNLSRQRPIPLQLKADRQTYINNLLGQLNG